MVQVKQVEMMTNPPSYTLLNVRAGRSQGILTGEDRLTLKQSQPRFCHALKFGLEIAEPSYQQRHLVDNSARKSVLAECPNKHIAAIIMLFFTVHAKLNRTFTG